MMMTDRGVSEEELMDVVKCSVVEDVTALMDIGILVKEGDSRLYVNK
jgi:hypothetical protein